MYYTFKSFYIIVSLKNGQQLEKLRSDHSDILGSSLTVQQGIDVVKANIKWMELHQVEIGTCLNQNPPAETPLPPTTTTSMVGNFF